MSHTDRKINAMVCAISIATWNPDCSDGQFDEECASFCEGEEFRNEVEDMLTHAEELLWAFSQDDGDGDTVAMMMDDAASFLRHEARRMTRQGKAVREMFSLAERHVTGD